VDVRRALGELTNSFTEGADIPDVMRARQLTGFEKT
jgi:hypothetical protein